MYKKLRYSFRLVTALIRKYYLSIFLGCLFGVLAFFILPPLYRHLSISRPVKNIGLVGRYSLTDLPASVLDKVSLGLTVVSDSGLPSAGLATDWQATDSGKTYLFTLNPSLRWHDGSNIRSQDLVFPYKDISIEYPDVSHILVRLKDPFSPLPVVLSHPLLKVTKFPRRFLGVGTYRVSSFRLNGPYLETLTLTPPSTSSLPVLKYHFYDTQIQARTAFKLGLLNIIEDLADLADLKQWGTIQITPTIHNNRYVAVFFNTSGKMFSGSDGKNLRLALTYATDKNSISSDTQVTGPISSTSWAYSSEVKKYNFDPTKAKQLISKLGKKPETIELSVISSYLDIGEQIKKYWEAVGLTVNLTVVQDIPAEYEALLVAQATPEDPDQYNLWHSTQNQSNLTHLNNPRIDKLLEDGRKTLDLIARKQIYKDFQRYLIDEAPAIFLFHPKSYTVSRN